MNENLERQDKPEINTTPPHISMSINGMMNSMVEDLYGLTKAFALSKNWNIIPSESTLSDSSEMLNSRDHLKPSEIIIDEVPMEESALNSIPENTNQNNVQDLILTKVSSFDETEKMNLSQSNTNHDVAEEKSVLHDKMKPQTLVEKRKPGRPKKESVEAAEKKDLKKSKPGKKNLLIKNSTPYSEEKLKKTHRTRSSIEVESDPTVDFVTWLRYLDKAGQASNGKKGKPHKPKQTEHRVQELNQKAKSSQELKAEVVSETLAALLAQQGHHSKAIKMYEKLARKFPEKSANFAALIKKLKS